MLVLDCGRRLYYIADLELGHVAAAFRDNAVDGRMLASLSETDLVSELGLKPLQACKVLDLEEEKGCDFTVSLVASSSLRQRNVFLERAHAFEQAAATRC